MGEIGAIHIEIMNGVCVCVLCITLCAVYIMVHCIVYMCRCAGSLPNLSNHIRIVEGQKINRTKGKQTIKTNSSKYLLQLDVSHLYFYFLLHQFRMPPPFVSHFDGHNRTSWIQSKW